MIVIWVYEIQYSDTEIKKESIFNSFKKSGITLKLDGSEDEMVDETYEGEKEFINANDIKPMNQTVVKIMILKIVHKINNI